jgi:raffinose/stachyose/melibiose transport system substrate-binding protein
VIALLRSSFPRLAIVLILGALTLAGCGTSNSAGIAATTLHVWYSTDDPVERVWVQNLARQYTQTHPAVHVQVKAYSFEDINTKLQLALQGGDPPDVAYVTPRGPGIPAYLHANRLLNLASAARSHDWASRLRPGLLASYNAPFPHYGAPTNAIMAVPTSMAAVGVLYNRSLLAKLHLSVPPTLAQFAADLGVAKRAGYTPLGMGNADGWLGDDWYLTLVQALASPSSMAAEQRLDPSFSFQTPAFHTAAITLHRWATAGYFTRNFGGLDAQDGVDLFFRGKTLFQMISSSENLQIGADESETHLAVGVFAFPRAHGGTVMPQSGYLGWIVPKAGTHHASAVAFIDSLLTPTTTTLLQTRGLLPAHRAGRLLAAHPSSGASSWQADYRNALNSSTAGVYIDAAPIANLNATMEANVQLLLQGYEAPSFLVKALQEDYATRRGSNATIDGEF